MTFTCLLPEIFGNILSRTDAETVQSVLCTSRSTCDWIRSFRDLIRLENRLKKFIESLPVVRGSQNDATEKNVHVFDTSADEKPAVEQHALHKRGCVILANRDVLYKSISCPVNAKLIRLNVGGMTILRLDECQLRMCEEGYIDLMAFLRFLPQPMYHEIRIDYDVGDQHLSLSTSSVTWMESGNVSWKIFQIDDVCSTQHTYPPIAMDGGLSLECRCMSNHMSLGHIVTVEKDGRLVTDCVKNFTVIVDNHPQCQVPGPHCRWENVPKDLCNCPVNLRDCYYIQMSEKVNFSRVNNFLLDINFYQKVNVKVTVYNIYSNYARAAGGMMGLRFAS